MKSVYQAGDNALILLEFVSVFILALVLNKHLKEILYKLTTYKAKHTL